MLIHQESGIQDFEDNHIYLGEDWYLIYEEIDNHTVYISDLAKLNPELVDEASIQNKEMMDVIYDLVKKYDQIKADLKEDTSYLLFLANKKLEYLEQIGEDIAYPFNNSSNRKIVTEEEQVSILKQSKMIKEQGNPDNIMHHITFKKGRKLENMNLDNQYKK